MPKKIPDDMSPFLRCVRQRGRPHKVVRFPGSEQRVAIVSPTAHERTEAEIAARKFIAEAFNNDALKLALASEMELFYRERDIELLALVLKDPDDPTQAYVESVDDLRDPDNGFTDEDRRALIASIDDFAHERYDSIPDGEEEVVALVKGLKADGRLSDFVMSCDGDIAKRMLLSTARAL